jgi:uncharacterized short protein YbdD (DUF466 family)
LADELLAMDMAAIGTVMSSRKEMPETPNKKKIDKMRQGDLLYFRNNDRLALAWRDKHTVMCLVLFIQGGKNYVTEVPSKYPNKPPMKKQNMVLNYAKHMGGVDQ